MFCDLLHEQSFCSGTRLGACSNWVHEDANSTGHESRGNITGNVGLICLCDSIDVAAGGFLFQKEGPGRPLCVELVPQWRHLLVNDMSYVVTKTPLPLKNSWLGAELCFGIKDVKFF